MELVYDVFSDRKSEISSHIELLAKYEESIKSSRNEESLSISMEQRHILYACTYLLIYNMIESVINSIVKVLERKATEKHNAQYHLSEKFVLEWLNVGLKQFNFLSPEKKTKKVLTLFKYLNHSSESHFKMQIGFDDLGNMTDGNISKLATRLGADFSNIPESITQAVKKAIYDQKGCIEFIVITRNKLAHGEISFTDFGRNETLEKISDIYEPTCNYIKAVIDVFNDFIENEQYLISQP